MGQIREALVPDIGDYSDVPVIELLVQPGERVEQDQGLITLESDKATMEVPSPMAGTLVEFKVKLGDSVSEGQVVALIDVDEGAEAAPTAPAAQPAETPAEPAPMPAPAPVAASAPAPVAMPAPAAPAGETRTPPVSFDAAAVDPGQVPYASPAVRLFARELGVDLSLVAGSGRQSRILREDVQNFVKSAMQGGAGPAVAASAGGGLNLLPWPKVDFAKFGEIESEPLSRIKKISGANLARNWAMIPHVTQHDLVDITDMEAFRKQLGKENPDRRLTPLVFQIKAAVAALRAFPDFNASLSTDGESLIRKKYFHIGIAVDTPNGLVVPVIRDCDRKGLLELADELGAISKKAREGKLGPADMSGGCFSISSLGGIGGTAFTPIINAPEVAILGVSKSSMQPQWNGSAFEPRLMLPLSLSYDHRVIDGAAAARFTRFLAEQLSDLRRLLL